MVFSPVVPMSLLVQLPGGFREADVIHSAAAMLGVHVVQCTWRDVMEGPKAAVELREAAAAASRYPPAVLLITGVDNVRQITHVDSEGADVTEIGEVLGELVVRLSCPGASGKVLLLGAKNSDSGTCQQGMFPVCIVATCADVAKVPPLIRREFTHVHHVRQLTPEQRRATLALAIQRHVFASHQQTGYTPPREATENVGSGIEAAQ